jgi:hypothetical protein
MLRNLLRLLVPPSYHTIYGRRTRARVINYWHQGANVLPVSLPTAPSEITRKIRPEQPEDAMWSPLIFAQNLKLAKANVTNGN